MRGRRASLRRAVRRDQCETCGALVCFNCGRWAVVASSDACERCQPGWEFDAPWSAADVVSDRVAEQEETLDYWRRRAHAADRDRIVLRTALARVADESMEASTITIARSALDGLRPPRRKRRARPDDGGQPRLL